MSEAITRASSNPAPVAESGAIELDKLDDKHLEGNETAHLPNVPGAHDDTIHGINAKGEVVDPHGSAGLAVIEQRSAIPTTGKRLITSKREVSARCAHWEVAEAYGTVVLAVCDHVLCF